jgi:peptidoglycan hydrolase-like protein with peptidoglycan-binding domain
MIIAGAMAKVRTNMIRKISLMTLAVGMPLVLAACGDTTEDRALSGAGIGAAGGAVIGAVTPVGALGGALIGGAVGGATGALTDSSQVNLGKPAWRSGSASAGTQTASATPDASYDGATVRDIQAGLQRLGYDPGPADGRFGAKTESAIRQYQQDTGLAVDGQPTASLLQNIRSRIAG